jgi:hypothetical protein
MAKERPGRISQETLAEMFQEICDKLESNDDKLDEILDRLPSSDSYDSHLNDD